MANETGTVEEKAKQLLDELAGMRVELGKRVRSAKKKKAEYEAARKDLQIRYGLYVLTVRDLLEIRRVQGEPIKIYNAGAGRPDRWGLSPELLLLDEEGMREVLGIIVNPGYFIETKIAYDSREMDLDNDQRDCWLVLGKREDGSGLLCSKINELRNTKKEGNQ
jgi:hypothetical protein